MLDKKIFMSGPFEADMIYDTVDNTLDIITSLPDEDIGKKFIGVLKKNGMPASIIMDGKKIYHYDRDTGKRSVTNINSSRQVYSVIRHRDGRISMYLSDNQGAVPISGNDRIATYE